MKVALLLIKRNVKLFFKDKGMFFTALITPAILLVLYATFLANVYRDSFESSLPAGIVLEDKLVNGLVGGQLIASLLAVSCVTVAFCSNFLMVSDKVSGAARDLGMTPAKSSTVSLSYYVATLISTLLITFVAAAVCLVYVASIGWYMSVADVFYLVLDIFLLVLFGTALSSLINVFLTTQGQISAVGTVISAGYGFIAGAYMPISSFGEGLQKVISFLPSTYGTALIKNHALCGVLTEMENIGVPTEAVEGIRDALDCNIYFFDSAVSVSSMYAIVGASTALLVLVFVLVNTLKNRRKIK